MMVIVVTTINSNNDINNISNDNNDNNNGTLLILHSVKEIFFDLVFEGIKALCCFQIIW